MTKQELVENISVDTDIERELVLKMVESFIKTTKTSLKRGEDVTLRGWGTLGLHQRAATTGRNIKAGTSIRIPARNIVKFSAAIEFAESVK